MNGAVECIFDLWIYVQKKNLSHLLIYIIITVIKYCIIIIFNLLLLYACGKRGDYESYTHIIIMMILTTIPLKVTLHPYHPPDSPLQKLLPNLDETNQTLPYLQTKRVISSLHLFFHFLLFIKIKIFLGNSVFKGCFPFFLFVFYIYKCVQASLYVSRLILRDN